MTKLQIEALKNSFDLREIAGEYTTLKGGNEQYGACPVCGGENRFHVSSYMYFCRQCKPMETGRHDIFDFLVWVGTVRGFKEAVAYLESRGGSTNLSPVRQNTTAPIELRYNNQTWQTKAVEYTKIAHQRLYREPTALEYLTNRGIHQETWKRAKLGFSVVKDSEEQLKEAITIPWFLNGKVIAVQNRMIRPGAEKYTRFGSGGYYGTAIVYIPPGQEQTDKLVIVEGEINALSIAQEVKTNVISIGSQNWGGVTITELKKQVAKYQHIFIWTDEQKQAEKLKMQLGVECKIINSNGSDANDLLKDGQLNNYLIHYFDQMELL